MADMEPIAWPLPANWDGGITETLEWLTALLSSETGAEQRRQLRVFPRRSFTANYIVDKNNRAWADIALQDRSAFDWYFPVWWDVFWLPGGLSVASESISLPATLMDYKVGNKAYIRGGADRDIELVDVTGVFADHITISATTRAFAAPVRVYPARLGRFTEQPAITRLTDRNYTMQTAVEFNDNSDWPAYTFPETYKNYPVFDEKPNEDDTITNTADRLTVVADNTTGIVKTTDTANLYFSTQTFYWTVRSYESHARLRSLLYYFKGRIAPAWIPTHYEDVKLARDLAAGSVSALIENIGYTAFGGQRPGKQDLYILMKDGTHAIRSIKTSVDGVGTETLIIDKPFTAGLKMADVARISFICLMRLNQDSVEIAHETDTSGVTRITAAFRNAPDLRNANEVKPFAFINPFMNDADCGCFAGCCGAPWIENLGIPPYAWVFRYQDYLDTKIVDVTLTDNLQNAILAGMTSNGATDEEIADMQAQFITMKADTDALADADAVKAYLAPLFTQVRQNRVIATFSNFLDGAFTLDQIRMFALNVHLNLIAFFQWNLIPKEGIFDALNAYRALLPRPPAGRILAEFCTTMRTTDISDRNRGFTSGFWMQAADELRRAGIMNWLTPLNVDFSGRPENLYGPDWNFRSGTSVVPIMLSEFWAELDFQGNDYDPYELFFCLAKSTTSPDGDDDVIKNTMYPITINGRVITEYEDTQWPVGITVEYTRDPPCYLSFGVRSKLDGKIQPLADQPNQLSNAGTLSFYTPKDLILQDVITTPPNMGMIGLPVQVIDADIVLPAMHVDTQYQMPNGSFNYLSYLKYMYSLTIHQFADS